ncbi:hypothetical protein [Sinomonas halotolerans]|uniref:Uncharacterized protein n=1 Tax=Sinomonas halotolerans TaxID=1644133 RepID=A0ABU9WZX1_9MICC
MHKHVAIGAVGGWLRAVVLACAVMLFGFAAVHQITSDASERRRIEAAAQLAAASASAAPGQPGAPAPSGAATASAAPALPPSAAPAPTTPDATATAAVPRLALPPRAFAWPAAGLSVGVVPMSWKPGTTVVPPLDANGFDPVAHWLKGTGQSKDRQPVVLAAHTCYGEAPLCSPETFPFNRLSYAGWAKGQAATITDAAGKAIPCVLQDRRLVDKSKAFSFANDPRLVVVFSCNTERPLDEITLVIFRCGQKA